MTKHTPNGNFSMALPSRAKINQFSFQRQIKFCASKLSTSMSDSSAQPAISEPQQPAVEQPASETPAPSQDQPAPSQDQPALAQASEPQAADAAPSKKRKRVAKSAKKAGKRHKAIKAVEPEAADEEEEDQAEDEPQAESDMDVEEEGDAIEGEEGQSKRKAESESIDFVRIAPLRRLCKDNLKRLGYDSNAIIIQKEALNKIKFAVTERAKDIITKATQLVHHDSKKRKTMTERDITFVINEFF
jgi:histone H3/H4